MALTERGRLADHLYQWLCVANQYQGTDVPYDQLDELAQAVRDFGGLEVLEQFLDAQYYPIRQIQFLRENDMNFDWLDSPQEGGI